MSDTPIYDEVIRKQIAAREVRYCRHCLLGELTICAPCTDNPSGQHDIIPVKAS